MLCPQCQASNLAQDKYCRECALYLGSLGVFSLQRSIKEGGFGAVYRGRNRRTGYPVAIKVMHKHIMSQERAKERFLREIEVLQTLQHPHIVRIFDHGYCERLGFYIVMEWLEGEDLNHLLLKHPETTFPIKRWLPLFLQLLDALDSVHQSGIVHRDLKPQNLRVVQEHDAEVLKLLDFGIAWSEGNEQLTHTGIAMGTPHFMSPEQIECKRDQIGPHSDLYAAGVILAWLLTGEYLFDGENSQEICFKQCYMAAPSLKELRPDLDFSPEIQALVERAVQKDSAERFSKASDFIDEIHKVFAPVLQDVGFFPLHSSDAHVAVVQDVSRHKETPSQPVSERVVKEDVAGHTQEESPHARPTDAFLTPAFPDKPPLYVPTPSSTPAPVVDTTPSQEELQMTPDHSSQAVRHDALTLAHTVGQETSSEARSLFFVLIGLLVLMSGFGVAWLWNRLSHQHTFVNQRLSHASTRGRNNTKAPARKVKRSSVPLRRVITRVVGKSVVLPVRRVVARRVERTLPDKRALIEPVVMTVRPQPRRRAKVPGRALLALNKIKASEIFLKGVRAEENQAYNKAIRLFQRTIQLSPHHAGGHYRLGHLLMKNMSCLKMRMPSSIGACQRAALHLQMYLDIEKDMSAPERIRAVHFLKKLTKVQLRLYSSPSSVVVYAGQQRVGTTPLRVWRKWKTESSFVLRRKGYQPCRLKWQALEHGRWWVPMMPKLEGREGHILPCRVRFYQ